MDLPVSLHHFSYFYSCCSFLSLTIAFPLEVILKQLSLKQIRMQLEALLAEKSRLAQENSMYARENRFLREIVDFHQFTGHDVVSFRDSETKDNKPEGRSYSYAENMFPVVDAYLDQEEVSPVPSRSESPIVSRDEPSSPKSSNSVSNAANSPRNSSKPNELVPDKD
jgi:hypothetical protein